MPRSTPLFNRPDTMFGVCEGLGRDLGIHPNFLRVAFGIALMWQPIWVIAAYVVLGIAVHGTRALFPGHEAATESVAPTTATDAAINDDHAAPDRIAA